MSAKAPLSNNTGTTAARLRVATFNVSMEGSNYVPETHLPNPQALPRLLQAGDCQQIANIAEIIQRIRPDVILLNEFDYIPDSALGVERFLQNYLQRPQGSRHSRTDPIDYPYYYSAPVNTGVDSGLDLDGDGIASGVEADALGYGFYPGQYGMLLLSRYPIATEAIRTFQHFLWRDMPNNLMQSMQNAAGQPYYSSEAQAILPLSSKSHWDIPIKLAGQWVHILASHPTPPVFDGPERRNGKRNHDEIRFWLDYLTPKHSGYIYDDNGHLGGLSESEAFIILGDLNADPCAGDSHGDIMARLLNHPRVQSDFTPKRSESLWGPSTLPHTQLQVATGNFGLRVDYALPSRAHFTILAGEVYHPNPQWFPHLAPERHLTSDHSPIWLDLSLHR